MQATDSDSKLSPESTTGQAFRSGLDAARSVQCLGTTAPEAESQGNSRLHSGVEVTVWCEAVGPGCTFSARWFDGVAFYGGSGSTAIEAVAASFREYVERGAVAPMPPIVPRSGSCVGASHDDAPRAPAAPVISDEERAAEWQADLEYVWRVRTSEAGRILSDRARRYRRIAKDPARCPPSTPRLRVVLLRAAEWAEHRARALAMSRADVASACGKRWRSVTCGCGPREMRVGCDQPQLCGTCRRKHSQKWRKRITAGMDAALREERARWHRSYPRRGMRPGIYLITLTAPHSGDLATDREAMGGAVRKLLKHATKYDWWRTYALTWEATSGADGLGHMHAHLAVISSWVPYTSKQAVDRGDAVSGRRRVVRGLHDVWRDAMPGAVVLDVKAPRTGADDAQSAGQYLAKYVTKGVDAAEFTGRKAGELLVAFRCRRKVTTSAGFWVKAITDCECCGEAYRSLGAPCSLQELMPAAVLRSMAERTRYRDVDRFPPQVALRWGPDVIGS